MNAISEVVRKHMEAMHDALGELIAEDVEKNWAERKWQDGKDFAVDVHQQISLHIMTRAEYADWFEDHRTRGVL